MTGSYTRYNSVFVDKDDLAEDALEASTEGSSTFTSTSAAFCASTLTFTPAQDLPDMYIDINL